MKRELFALVAIPIMVVTIGWAPAWGFLIILGAAALFACDEYLRLARTADFVVGRWLVLILIGALLVASCARVYGSGVVVDPADRSPGASGIA